MSKQPPSCGQGAGRGVRLRFTLAFPQCGGGGGEREEGKCTFSGHPHLLTLKLWSENLGLCFRKPSGDSEAPPCVGTRALGAQRLPGAPPSGTMAPASGRACCSHCSRIYTASHAPQVAQNILIHTNPNWCYYDKFTGLLEVAGNSQRRRETGLSLGISTLSEGLDL